MGIGGSQEVKDDGHGLPAKHIFSPIGSPPTHEISFRPITSKNQPSLPKDLDVPTEPVVFRWHHKGRDKIPREVWLHGEWDDDHPVRLVLDTDASNSASTDRAARPGGSQEDEGSVFMTIVNLPVGDHFYHFTVDGKVCLAPDQPIKDSRNYAHVVPSDTYLRQQTGNDDEGWGQDIPELPDPAVAAASPVKQPARKTKNQGPVELPAHLERALLNSQPIADDPSMLPLPHHVMLNHLYSRPSLYNSYILGLTVRYRENYVTVVLYKPTDSFNSGTQP